MIIGLLVCAIGIIPIVLAFSVNRIYKGTKLSYGLLLYMILITIWQVNVGVLYFKDFLSEEVILFLFRLFRLAPTFAIPVVFMVAYEIIQIYSTSFKNGRLLNRALNVFFTKKMLYSLIAWSTFVYTISWTNYGIIGLELNKTSHYSTDFYFPIYGSLSWIYIAHVGSFLVFLIIIYLITKQIPNSKIKNFLSMFAIYSLLLFITGFINFFPGAGIIASSLGVIVFSILIMLEFVKLNNTIQLDYYQLLERQKKLDYTGDLAGSLIHEMKNINQVIIGFSKLLQSSPSLSKDDKQSLEMINMATNQLEAITDNYKTYMIHSKMDFNMVDINFIINQAMTLSKEILNEKQVDIELIKFYSPVMAYVNKTYLQQVFINLIKNSVEAIPMDNEQKKITINTSLIDDRIIINMYDTGKGIPEGDWEQIFDPFLSSKSEGWGLGLPFVKKIIFEHRGDIHIMNSNSSGTHFQITIPQLGVIEIDNLK